jgi:PAS domain S-box-containing protein
MMSLLPWIWQAPSSEDEWTRFIYSFFYRSLLIILLMLVLVLASVLSSEGSNLSRLPTLYSLGLITILSLTLLKRGHLRLAMHSFIWAAWAINAYSAFTSIGVYTPAYLVVIILVILAGLGLSWRNTIFFTSVVVGFGLILVYGHSQGWIATPQGHNLNPLAMWLTTSSISIVLAYVVITVRETSFAMMERLRRDQALYRAIVEDQTEFIVRWKAGGIRTFANGAYLRYFGITEDQALGTNFFPHINEDDRNWVNGKIARLSLQNPIDIGEHRVIRPDGTEGWQEWSDRALFDNAGNLLEYQSVGRDITAIKELEERQRELNLAKEREEFLRDFLSTMSHDLQTPLSVMRTNLYMLKKSPDKSPERIEKIDKQIDKLSSMIADILTVARLEHLPDLEHQPNNIANLLENSINPLRDEARAKNIELEMAELPFSVTIEADATEFQRAISNLISNAIKYTPEGGKICVEIQQDKDKLLIEIIDSGIGIDDEDLPHIFERFYRAKNAKNFEKGTGLGLAIVQRIVELHHGTISVKSHLGEGSRFIISLPLLRQSLLI